ncbi:MAG: DUF72 domain-containing protein [Bacteroidota bacterium]
MNSKRPGNTKKYGTLWTGTCNIVLPFTKSAFPGPFRQQTRLAYYASLFNTVEINSSFYKVPRPVTFEKWSQEVPNGFRFAVKLWRNITHTPALAFKRHDVDFFMKAANQADDAKKGCLLIQFPAGLKVNFAVRVETLLKQLQEQDPQGRWHKCVEFRDNGWYNPDVYAMLDRYSASLVLQDMPASALYALHTRRGPVYLRFHGLKGDYRGTYDIEVLRDYGHRINQWLVQGKDVYAYFNNTIGNAFDNARSLQELVAVQAGGGKAV